MQQQVSAVSIKNVSKKSLPSSKPSESLKEKNDVVGSIINNMNIQTVNVENSKHKNVKTYDIMEFFGRIANWNYSWLVEQERILLADPNSKKLPPIIDDKKELHINVDKFVSYGDYYKYMFPMLLLETWEEIRNSLKEQQKKSKEKRTYQNAPIWLKEIHKYNENSNLVKLVFQSKVCLIFKVKCNFNRRHMQSATL